MPGKTAYLTGGASGIGLAVSEMLAARGIRVCIADQNLEGAQAAADKIGNGALAVQVNIADWDSQVAAFENAIEAFGRLDYVFAIAGIGEKNPIENEPNAQGFQKPNLLTLDVDLNGPLYTAFLAVQQMRRQDRDPSGYRGKIVITASVMGFYVFPTIPLYVTAKHGIVGFVRSYGSNLPEEGITLNAVCPSLIRTNLASRAMYDQAEAAGVLTPMKGVVDAFESFLGDNMSGECLEVGPNGGFAARPPEPYLDPESARLLEVMYEMVRPR